MPAFKRARICVGSACSVSSDCESACCASPISANNLLGIRHRNEVGITRLFDGCLLYEKKRGIKHDAVAGPFSTIEISVPKVFLSSHVLPAGFLFFLKRLFRSPMMVDERPRCRCACSAADLAIAGGRKRRVEIPVVAVADKKKSRPQAQECRINKHFFYLPSSRHKLQNIGIGITERINDMEHLRMLVTAGYR